MLPFNSKSTLFIKGAYFLISPYMSFYIVNIFVTFWMIYIHFPSLIWEKGVMGAGGVRAPVHNFSGQFLQQGVPRPANRYNPSSVSWVCSGISSQLDMAGTPPLAGILTRYPNHPNWLLSTWRSSSSTLSLSRMS